MGLPMTPTGDLPYIQCHFVGLKKIVDGKEKARHHIHFEVGKCRVGAKFHVCLGDGKVRDVVWMLYMIYGCFWRPRPS